MADDHPIFRNGLRQIVLSDPDLDVIHETGNGLEALRQIRELRPDLAILDMDMPGLNGLDLARARQRERLPFEIIFLTMYREEDMFREALDLGARGYVLKESAAADILQCIHAVARGQHYVSPTLAGLLINRGARNTGPGTSPAGLASLTPSERRILKLIASDQTSKEIADHLGLSPRTIENHRANMSAKLGLQGSHSLLKFAFENKARL